MPRVATQQRRGPKVATLSLRLTILLFHCCTMRPITLEITGFHSFRQKQVIKFDHLLADGLFGIFGPTGSGKSSILDAITLALYGNVHRTGYGIQGIMNKQETNASVVFTFEIGNGAERQRYTAERHFVRKKEETQVRRLRLTHHTPECDVVLAEKKGEVDQAIQNIIGLTLQDFRHAVMLPQGRFADFLALTGSQRGEVLQRLFGLQQYGEQLDRKLKKRMDAIGIEQAELSGGLAQLDQFNDEALERCKRDLDEATAARTAAQQALGIATERAAAAAELLTLLERLSETERAAAALPEQELLLGRHHAARDRAQRAQHLRQPIGNAAEARKRHAEALEEYNESVEKVRAHQPKLTAARDRWSRAAEAFEGQEQREDVVKQLNGLKQSKERLQRDLGELRKRKDLLDEASKQVQAREQARQEAEAKKMETEERAKQATQQLKSLEISHQQQAQITLLRQLLWKRTEAATQLHHHQAELERTQHQRTELQAKEQAAKQELEKLSAAANNTNQQRDAARERERELGETLQNLRATHSQLTEARSVLQTLNLHGLQEQAAALETKLAELRRNHATQEPEVSQAESNHLAARSRREELQRRMGLAAAALHLHDGQPCPLCGALDHPAPYRPEEGEQGELQERQGEELRCEKIWKEAAGNLQKLDREIAAAESKLQQLHQDIARAGTTANKAMSDLREALSRHPEPIAVPSPDNLESAIAAITQRGEEAKLEKSRAAENLKQIEAQAANNEQALNQKSSQLATIGGALASIHTSHQQQSQKVADQTRQLQAISQELQQHAGDRSIEEVETELVKLAEREKAAADLKKKCEEIEAQRKTEQANHDTAREAETAAKLRHAAAETAWNGLLTQVEQAKKFIGEEFQKLVPNRAAGETIERIAEEREAELKRIEKEHSEARMEYESAQSAQHLLSEANDKCFNKRCKAEQERDTLNAACRAAIAEQGFASEEEATAALLEPAEIGRLVQEITTIEGHIREVRKQEAELREQVGGRTITHQEVEQLREAQRIAQEEANNAIGQAGGAQSRLEECQEQNQLWHQQQARSSVVGEQMATIQQLGKYLHKNQFVNYLANERLDDVCRRATRLLESSTNGLLELRSDKESGFYIIDNCNGGIRREVNSLSGGETFLVSLSLALALSDTIQLGHAPLEFFFLDEGFGTLDSQLLDAVMNGLERLRSPNRAIGIISHVQELRQRIPQKLIVTPATTERGTTVEYDF